MKKKKYDEYLKVSQKLIFDFITKIEEVFNYYNYMIISYYLSILISYYDIIILSYDDIIE